MAGMRGIACLARCLVILEVVEACVDIVEALVQCMIGVARLCCVGYCSSLGEGLEPRSIICQGSTMSWA